MTNGHKKDINWTVVAIAITVVILIALGGLKACSSRGPDPVDTTAIDTIPRPTPVPAIVDTADTTKR